jgi:hypothetical protein
MRRLGWLVSVVVLALFVSSAGADAPDPDAVRIAAAGHSLKWNWTPPGRGDRFGHGETLIHAPIATVRRLVLDFARYTELAPSITASRVVGRDPSGAAEVYLRMGVLSNAFTLWSVIRFAPAQVTPSGAEVVEGQMVKGKGNINDAVLVWTLRAVDSEWTVLKLDFLLRPGVPVPASLLDEQLRDSAMDAVNSLHDRAQGSKEIAPYPSATLRRDE